MNIRDLLSCVVYKGYTISFENNIISIFDNHATHIIQLNIHTQQENIQIFINCASYLGCIELLNAIYDIYPSYYDYRMSLGYACTNNQIHVLYWLYDKHLIYDYCDGFHDHVAAKGYVNVLKFFIDRKLPLKLTNFAIDMASGNGHIHMLDILIQYTQEYSKLALNLSILHGHTNSIIWWLNSKLPLNYDHTFVDRLCEYGLEDIINTWLQHDKEFIYSENAIDLAIKNGHYNILFKWPLKYPIKYSYKAIEYACNNDRIDVLQWFVDHNLPIYLPHDISKFKSQNVVDWLINYKMCKLDVHN